MSLQFRQRQRTVDEALLAKYTSLRRGVAALVATTRCYRRPESKLAYDPGPCGYCAVCLAKRAFYGEGDWRDS